MTSSAIDEVRRLHVFIEQWLSGGPVEEDGWQRFEDSLADQFEMVVPAGDIVSRAELLVEFSKAHGVASGVEIEIREAAILYSGGDLSVVRYEEWQLHESLSNQRVSTAVLGKDAAAPGGWSWLALHETSLALPSDSLER